ncbi:hypothetical protein ACTXT7_009405 [Hymenolepis weldensis]
MTENTDHRTGSKLEWGSGISNNSFCQEVMRFRVILAIFLLVLIALAKKDKKKEKEREITWVQAYKRFNNKIDGGFVKNQLQYFAGWKQHQGGTYENTILADWRLNPAFLRRPQTV